METASKEGLQIELDKLKAELTKAREAALEGNGREAELERQSKLALEAEREKRVEHTQRMAMMRLGKRDLTMGWTTWLNKYKEYKRTLNMLKGSAARLLRPKMAAAVAQWRRDWEASEAAKAQMSVAQRLKQAETAQAAAEREASELRAELKKAGQARRAQQQHAQLTKTSQHRV